MKNYLYKTILSLIFSLFIISYLSAQRATINELFEAGEYERLIELITEMQTLKELPDERLNVLAYSYVALGDYPEAEKVYEELVGRESRQAKYHLYYADVLFANRRLEKSKSQYKAYLSQNPDDVYAGLKMQSCDSLLSWQNHESDKIVKAFSQEESEHDASGEVFKRAHFLFLPERNGFSFRKDSMQMLIKKPWLTSDYWCSSVAYNETDQILAYSVRKREETRRGILYGNSKIMFDKPDNPDVEQLKAFSWENMPENINITHPSFAKNGTRLYFASDMPGGKGGTDLYYSDYAEGVWSVPVNLGSPINTAFNELSPAKTGDTLYYASDGHPGYGRLDIFYSLLDEAGYSLPINVKAPINSLGNDLLYRPYSDKKALLSSDRAAPEQAELDVYSVITIQEEQADDLGDDSLFVQTLNLEAYQLPYLFFATDQSDIHPEYIPVLRNLADSLEKYENVHLKIFAYADINGKKNYNKKLSVERAKTLYDTLVNFGAPDSQMTYEAFGESKDSTLSNLKYHVFIGTALSADEAEWYEKMMKENYPVRVTKNGSYYSYYVGEFDKAAQAYEQANELERNYKLKPIVGASYKGEFLPEYLKAINRRAELKLSKESK